MNLVRRNPGPVLFAGTAVYRPAVSMAAAFLIVWVGWAAPEAARCAPGSGNAPGVSLRKDVPIAAASLLLLGGGYALARRVEPVREALTSRESILWPDRPFLRGYSQDWWVVSDVSALAALSAPWVLLRFAGGAGGGGGRAALETAVLYLETLSAVGGLRYLTGGVMPRARPYAYFAETPAEMLSSRKSRVSFFSGHAAAAFAAAELTRRLAKARGADTWPGWTAYGFAAVTAVARVAGGAHFPTDVVVGAVAGIATAHLIVNLHEEKEPRVCFGATPRGIMLRFSY